MKSDALPAGATPRCHLCGATTVVVVEGTRGAWCTGRRVEHRRVAMVGVKEEERRG